MTLEETVEREKHNSIVKVRTIRLYALKEQKIIQMKTQIVKPLHILCLTFPLYFSTEGVGNVVQLCFFQGELC